VKLHRIIEIAGFTPDPEWSVTQALPNPTLPTNGTKLQASTTDGRLYWTAIPYNGADPATATPSDGTGLTFDARLVYTRQPVTAGMKNTQAVIGRKSPGEVEGSLIATGIEVVETMPGRGTSGVLQMIDIDGSAPVGTTHLYLFWWFDERGGL
jgi:hypothetical protein